MTESRSLLVVDDDLPFRTRLVKAFTDRGFDAIGVGSAAEAIAAAQQDSPELALVDLRLGDDSGLDLVLALKRVDPTTNIVVLTGYGSIATAVESMKRGATTYLTKPVDARPDHGRVQRLGGARRRRGADPGPGRMGAHPARAGRLRRQRVAGLAAARHPPAVTAAQAVEASGGGIGGPLNQDRDCDDGIRSSDRPPDRPITRSPDQPIHLPVSSGSLFC